MDILYNIRSWVYIIAAVVLLALLLIFLWFRVQFKTKKIQKNLKIIEDDNLKKLHELSENFENKIARLGEDNKKSIQNLQKKYEKRNQDLEEKNARETESIKQDQAKILQEFEEYQKDLEKKSKIEWKKIRAQYEQEMKGLEEENSKLLNEMQYMLQERRKAEQPPPPIHSRRSTPKENELQFSDESFSKIEKQIEVTTEEMEKLKTQFIEIEKKQHEDFESAQSEIEALKFKIRHRDMRG